MIKISWLIAISIVMTTIVSADEIWSEGVIYRVTPTDNMITVKDYTIKAVDFPAPVRGMRTINDTIIPERPVNPFVTFELYKDIINNSNPINRFTLGIGDEFITSDKELRIVIDSMPDQFSQNWVYEYYEPLADIKIQKRGLPSLSTGIILDIDEDTIDPGEKFKMTVNISNTGEDIMKNIILYVEDPSRMMISDKLKRTHSRLDADEEKKILEKDLQAPKIIEEKEYEIYVNVSWDDAKDIRYYSNFSKKIKVKSAIDSLKFEKVATKDSIYLKEYEMVLLNIINSGNIDITDIQINDTLLNKTIYTRNNSVTQFFLNESSIGPEKSWSFDYTLKPLEPGIYILPRFTASFTMLGQQFEAESNEAGYRVFGPKIVLTKKAKRDEEEDDLADVSVVARNIGNGFARIVIEDSLPERVSLISGRLNSTTFVDPGTEKIMSYTVRIPWDMDIDDINQTGQSQIGETEEYINVTSWPVAKAKYYLDDYVFVTYSNETYPYDEKFVWTKSSDIARSDQIITAIKKEKEKEEEIIPTATVPKIIETPKKVVATIPAKTQVPEKSGYRFGETLIGIIGIILIIWMIRRKER